MTYTPAIVTGPIGASSVAVSGLTGAVSASRLVGANATGAPTTGTFVTGDVATDHAGAAWICTSGGTPGTWVEVSPGPTGATGATGAGLPTVLGSPGQIVGPVGAVPAWITPTNRGGLPDPTRADDQLLFRRAALVTTLVVGCIGDSITNGGGGTPQSPTAPEACATALSSASVTVTSVNEGVGGSYSGDWLPGSSNDTAAISAFAGAGVHLIHIMLGTNDATFTLHNTSAATFRANLRSILNAWVSRGYLVAVSYPPWSIDTGNDMTLSASYQPLIDGLINGVTVFQGDTSAFQLFESDTATYLQALPDGTHPTQAGANALGALWARAMQGVVQALTEETTLAPLTLGSGLSVSGTGPYTLDASGGGGVIHQPVVLSVSAGVPDFLCVGGDIVVL